MYNSFRFQPLLLIHFIFLLLCGFNFFPPEIALSKLEGNEPSPTGVKLPGFGILKISQIKNPRQGTSCQLILEKSGGVKQVISTVNTVSFEAVLCGDLDGDQIPDVVAVSRNKSSDDLMPFVFKGSTGLNLIFPENEIEVPFSGKAITLEPVKEGLSICIKIPVNFHDFGPPYLFLNEYYRIKCNSLVKIKELLLPATHFNQFFNSATRHFKNGNYQEALNGYSNLLASFSEIMPKPAQAEALFSLAETKKILKDFQGAIDIYLILVKSFKEHPQAELAQIELEFLQKNLDEKETLYFFIDAVKLSNRQKFREVLKILASTKKKPSQKIGDRLLFLKSETLFAMGRTAEAIQNLRQFMTFYHHSSLSEKAETFLNELEKNIVPFSYSLKYK